MAIKRPFKINNIIEVQVNTGKVLELNQHNTILENADNNIVIIPNTLISNGVDINIQSTTVTK